MNMTNVEERFKKKFKVGDIVIVPKELAELTHEKKGSQLAEVVELSRHIFDVKYLEAGFRQSIQYKDAGKINKILTDVAV